MTDETKPPPSMQASVDALTTARLILQDAIGTLPTAEELLAVARFIRTGE